MEPSVAQPRLLIVAPDEALHREYAQSCAAIGFLVEQTRDADGGLEKTSRLAPDMVLIDGSTDNGEAALHFCRRLQDRVSATRIPILALMGAGDALAAQEALLYGCGVQMMPCPAERVLVRIVRMLAGWPHAGLQARIGEQGHAVDQVERMIGHVLRVNAQLLQANAALAASAHLWADLYTQALQRANQLELTRSRSTF